MSELQTWLALLGKEAVYSVMASDEEAARQQIESELSRKPHRQSLLERWQADGRRVRMSKPRRKAQP